MKSVCTEADLGKGEGGKSEETDGGNELVKEWVLEYCIIDTQLSTFNSLAKRDLTFF